MTPSAVRDFMLEEGYKAKLDEDDSEAARISSGVDGIPFSLSFFRPAEWDGDLDAYDVVAYTAGIDVKDDPNLNKLNSVNANHRFLKAYAADSVVWIEMDITVPEGGLPDEVFKETFACWTTVMPEMVQEII